MSRKISQLFVQLPTTSWNPFVVPGLLLVSFLSGAYFQEEPLRTPALYAQSSDEDFTNVKKVKGKLPYYYGQLDLTEAQEKKVRALALYHRTEINKFKELVKRQMERRDEECEAQLTAEQRRKLKQIRKRAALKREKKKMLKKKK